MQKVCASHEYYWATVGLKIHCMHRNTFHSLPHYNTTLYKTSELIYSMVNRCWCHYTVLFFKISNVALFTCTLTCDGSVWFLNSSLLKGNGAQEKKRKETKSTDKAVIKFWVASCSFVLHSHSEVVILSVNYINHKSCKFTCARSIKGKSSVLSHDRCCRLWPLTFFYQIGLLKSVLY